MNKEHKKILAYKLFGEVVTYFASLYSLHRQFFFQFLETIKTHNLEKKLNIETGESSLLGEGLGLYRDGNGYQAAPYYVLEKIAGYLKLKPEDVFVDLGCGKGRVVFFFSRQKLKKVIGIELDKELIDIARENLNNFRLNKTPIELIHRDAVKLKIPEGSIFFLFNPFGAQTLQAVINNIKETLLENPRAIRVVYYSPAHRNILDNQDWLVRETEMKDPHCLSWHNKL